MAGWSVAFHLHKRRRNLLQRTLIGTQQVGGIINLVGRASAGLTSSSQPLANNEAARCSSLSRNPPRPRESVSGERSSSEGPCQEVLWRQFFLDQTRWLDNRQQKKGSCQPHFQHKESLDVLWLYNFSKPAWVDAQLAALDTQMGHRSQTSKSNLSDDPEPRRFTGYKRSLTAETVSKLCQQGQLTEAVEALGVLGQTDSRIPKFLFYAVLKHCVLKKDLDLGRLVQTLTVKMGYESDTFLCNQILRMYASRGRLQEAMDVFTLIAKPDAFTWSSVISAHVRHRQAKQAIQLYHQMRRSSVKPDGHVFVAALKACASGADLKTGQLVHADVLSSGVEPDLFVCSCLVDMYAKCGSLEAAESVFGSLRKKDVVTWNAMIAGYVQQGMGQEALHLYDRMLEEGISEPDCVTFVCLLQACPSLSSMAMDKGKQLHAQIEERGLQADKVVGCSLVNMYAKCGSLVDAQRVFDGLHHKDVVTWNAMIAGYAKQGIAQNALRLYSDMQQEGKCAPNSVTFVCLLQACASVASLNSGRQLHAQIEEQGLQSDLFVANSLINMYAKCGSLGDAQRVFEKLRLKNLVTWNTMIAGYAQQGMDLEALSLYNRMQQEGLTAPDSVTFVCLLQACASVGIQAMEKGKQLHVQIEERGLLADLIVGCSLVNMYAKFGSLGDAQSVFNRLHIKDVVTWNAMIAGYAQQSMGLEALSLYSRMQQEGISAPDSVTFVCLLQACASVGITAIRMGKLLHAQINERGLQADVAIGNSLVNMYAKCRSLEEARRLFDGLCQKDVVTWNAMIGGYAQQGMSQEALCLYSAMHQEGSSAPDSVTFVCLLQACANLGVTAVQKGKQLHAEIEELGLQGVVAVHNSLVSMYAKCGSLEDARSVFDRICEKDVVTWNVMIGGYVQHGMGQEALHLYSAMHQEGRISPDSVTFVCLLQACATVGIAAVQEGKQLHAEIEERGLLDVVAVGNSLVSMYTKCGSLEEARSVFDGLCQKDVVTWNTMIGGYAQQGIGQEALYLYGDMQEEGISVPDSVTFVCVLEACTSLGLTALAKGKELHGQIEEQGLQADLFVANSLINMYAKCGSLEEAQAMFDGLLQKDVVTWNAMIAGYVQDGKAQEAFSIYSRMQQEAIRAPGSVTFVCLLQACASVGVEAMEKGKQLHAQIEARGLQADVVVSCSLVNMYAKCGSLEDAQIVFDGLSQKNVVTWNAMIAGYVQQGMSQEALSLYTRMLQEGISAPDSVTFLCLLQAVASMAALHPGRQLHAQIEEHGLQADLFIANALINMYAKCGSMVDAQQVFDSLPERDIVAWNALVAGYTRQGDSEVVFDLVHRMREDCIQPNGITFLSVLTVCSHGGLVDMGREYFEAMSRQYGITPTMEHYTCMVDLLGRAGHLDEALAVVRKMPIQPDESVWHTLLGACQKWSSVEVGRHAFDEAVKLDGKDAAAYVMMSTIYTGAQMWEEADEMQARRKKIRARKDPGQSWSTDIGGILHTFVVGAEKHPES